VSESTRIEKQTNVVLRRALEVCAPLRGKNAFLDHALDAGDRVHLPDETRLIGYAKQEQAFLVFLKTLEPHLPRTPKTGPRSQGELLLRSESGHAWQVIFRYRDAPKIVVHRLAWLGVPLGKVRPLRAPKGAGSGTGASKTKAATTPGTRLVDPSGDFAVLRVASHRLVVVRGSAGSKGKTSTKTFAHQWQAKAAFDRLAGALRKKGFRRGR
jgi:hypothetical protein